MWEDLTSSQYQAVEHDRGPLLVLAGPGSGKTRVITYRIARLIDRGVRLQQILGLTFTNKAAQEMVERVRVLCPGSKVWISTFHRFCARLLRTRAEAVGLQPNFTILDATDQRQVLRDTLRDLGHDTQHYPPDRIGNRISRAKNQMLSPEDFRLRCGQAIGDDLQLVAADAYEVYQRRLLRANAVDFDDLLLHVVQLLRENETLRLELDARFQYVLVDEYQDTNFAQYQIVAALSQVERNLCVTGDPDQSIYGWRGAQIDNILRFEADFPGAAVVRLEQNFRSTAAILKSADRLIAHNRYRKPKSLLSDQREGAPVELCCFRDAGQEANFIARTIRERVESNGAKWSDFAVVYRVNSLTHEIELALTRWRIPFQIAAGVAFYERAEVKDLLAYLRLIVNPGDDPAFARIVNKPLRGIGKKTRDRLVQWSQIQDVPLLEAARRANQIPSLHSSKARRLQDFVALLDSLSLADAGSVSQLVHAIIDRTGYARAWQESTAERDVERMTVVNELVRVAEQYERFAEDQASLEGFLESASLASDIDGVDARAGKVMLMTLHAAKGLEFPVVFIVGLEQNLIPHERAMRNDNPHDFEEERRLLFVGMTRAMRHLYLTKVERRMVRGRFLHTIPSPFLHELRCDLRDYTDEPTDLESFSATMPRPERPKRTRHRGTATAEPKRPLLTTGAALLNGEHAEAAVPSGFPVGIQVRHPRYGHGTVVDVGGFAKNRTVTVVFDDTDRRETFVVNKSPLQPIGQR